MRFNLIFLIFTLTTSIVFSQKGNIFGKYVSNWGQDTLILHSDTTFKIIVDGIDSSKTKFRYELTGKSKIGKKVVEFVRFDQDDKHVAYWNCFDLVRKRKKLVRPLQCGPTHRFLIFEKVMADKKL